MKNVLFLIIAFILSYTSCDVIEEPYNEQQTNNCADEDLPIAIRKILLEDYTGHKCGNCPAAAAELQKLKSLYCDHIIPLSVHVGFFAQPALSGKYSTDFRTTTGNELNLFFKNDAAGLPNGMINRSEFNGNPIISPSGWSSAVVKLLDKSPEAVLEIAPNFNVNTRQLSVDVSTVFLASLSGEHYLSVYLVEDSIIGWQTDYSKDPVDVQNYMHRHVLRASLNGTWGDLIASGKIVQGTSISRNYSFLLHDNYKVQHCSVVAFVYFAENKEIIQAESENILKN